MIVKQKSLVGRIYEEKLCFSMYTVLDLQGGVLGTKKRRNGSHDLYCPRYLPHDKNIRSHENENSAGQKILSFLYCVDLKMRSLSAFL